MIVIKSVTLHHTYASVLIVVIMVLSADIATAALSMLKALLQKPQQHI